MVASLKQISSLLNGFSTEVTPASAKNVECFRSYLSPGTSVNVTFLPGSNIEDTVEVSVRLKNEGFNPVPHIVARNFKKIEFFVFEICLDTGHFWGQNPVLPTFSKI